MIKDDDKHTINAAVIQRPPEQLCLAHTPWKEVEVALTHTNAHRHATAVECQISQSEVPAAPCERELRITADYCRPVLLGASSPLRVALLQDNYSASLTRDSLQRAAIVGSDKYSLMSCRCPPTIRGISLLLNLWEGGVTA